MLHSGSSRQRPACASPAHSNFYSGACVKHTWTSKGGECVQFLPRSEQTTGGLGSGCAPGQPCPSHSLHDYILRGRDQCKNELQDPISSMRRSIPTYMFLNIQHYLDTWCCCPALTCAKLLLQWEEIDGSPMIRDHRLLNCRSAYVMRYTSPNTRSHDVLQLRHTCY